jgi:hypothetical protein
MKDSHRRSIRKRAIAGAIAGVPGGIAHALVNEIDRRVLNYDADDLLLVTGSFIGDKGKARTIGLFMHLGFAMAFGAAYAVVLNPKDDRDAVGRGIGAGLMENTILWPLVIPLDEHHPYIRDGRIDKFNHPISLLQANLRHIALGYGLGKTYPSILRRL